MSNTNSAPSLVTGLFILVLMFYFWEQAHTAVNVLPILQ